VVRARWLFAFILGVLGATVHAAGGSLGGLWTGVAVAGYNLALAVVLHRRGESGTHSLTTAQLLLDSLVSVVAIHYGMVLTEAVQFLFLFPLFVATLLSPREGLFMTAAVCGSGYAVARIAILEGYGQQPTRATSDATLATLFSIWVVIAALLAAACILNYLVRTLAGVEGDLAASERKYRELAGSLEDEVRQRTSDLRHANEQLNSRNRELLRLREIDATIHRSHDVGLVLQRVVDGVAEIVPASQAAIFLREPAADHLRLARYSTSAERRVAALEALLGDRLRDLRVPLHEDSLAGHTVRTREPFFTSDFERVLQSQVRDPLRRAMAPDIARIMGIRSAIALPLVVDDELIGLLAFGSRELLDRDEVDRVQAFATQAAIAVVRARQERDLLEHQAALQQAYDDLQRSQEQVINLEKMRAIGEMTSGVAHNFNNALTAILGTAQLVLMEDLSQPVAHRLRIIERTAQDAALLVQRIRAFTKDEPPQTTATDLNELMTDAAAMTEPRWKHHVDRVDSPITVDLELRAQRPVEVEPASIREVLINLILNAVNAMPQGGRLQLRTWDEGEEVALAVRDSGIGMSEETRQRCFEPFFTTGGDKGTGLGLSVAYGIIQRHNGEIRVSSSLGVGTEFVITLPAARQAAPARVALSEAAADDELPPLHALVVDDQPMVRQTIGEMLRALGHSATIANDGQEAVDVFDPSEHQLVITDWGMPGMSGLAVARAIKSRSPATPVVLVTGLDANLPAEVITAEEIDTRLQKPVALRDLARAIHTVHP
ncbi:MAG: response regulator, partial [Armatimonadetes bacterium]|nr:response regulator [Armatimonadota bacterium]